MRNVLLAIIYYTVYFKVHNDGLASLTCLSDMWFFHMWHEILCGEIEIYSRKIC